MTERFPLAVRRWMVPVAIWAIGLGVAVNSASTLILFRANRERAAQGAQAAEALCVFRADLQMRVRGSRQFLERHPRGISGISAKDIQTGIVNQSRTIDALRDLPCEKPSR